MLPRIKVLSAYHAQSHNYWYNRLTELPFEWSLSKLEARYFSWRSRGNPLSYLDTLDNFEDYSLVLSTSMVDLACLKGLFPTLHQKPCLLYFHENQFAYPSHQQKGILEAQITSIYSALTADSIAFNSEFNRQSFLDGVDRFIKKMPDCKPRNLRSRIEQKSRVIPVPIKEVEVKQKTQRETPIRILWNHRWEYDKGPELLEAILKRLKELQVDFSISIVGQQFRSQPEAFKRIKNQFHENIRHWGFIESRKAYEELLWESQVVLSTAAHDFQGISVLEAIAHQCYPVAPKALVYPEYLGSEYLYTSTESLDETAQNAVDTMLNLNMEHAPPQVPSCQCKHVFPQYYEWISEFIPIKHPV